jgi:hypothetical protein
VGAITDSAAFGSASRHSMPRRRWSNATTARSAAAKAPSAKRARAEFAPYRTRIRDRIAPLAFGFVTVMVLAVAWLEQDDGDLTPQSGIRYWLGIVGTSLMLMLLLYPLRKRMPALKWLGTVAFWFRAHMILGVVGPVLVLLHADLRLGSINSNVALAAMLIVTMSGLVGRYLHGKVHLGLHDRKAQVQQIIADADALRELIRRELPVAEELIVQLSDFALHGVTSPRGVLSGLRRLRRIRAHARAMRNRLIGVARSAIAREGDRLGWSRAVRHRRLAGLTDLITLHVTAVRRAAGFAVYERLFSLWHVFHVPLFFLLVIAASVHILAAYFF